MPPPSGARGRQQVTVGYRPASVAGEKDGADGIHGIRFLPLSLWRKRFFLCAGRMAVRIWAYLTANLRRIRMCSPRKTACLCAGLRSLAIRRYGSAALKWPLARSGCAALSSSAKFTCNFRQTVYNRYNAMNGKVARKGLKRVGAWCEPMSQGAVSSRERAAMSRAGAPDTACMRVP